MRTTVLVIALLSVAFLLNLPLQMRGAEGKLIEWYELPENGKGFLVLPEVPYERIFVKIKRKDAGQITQSLYIPLLIYNAAMRCNKKNVEREAADSDEVIQFRFDAGFVEQENGSEFSDLYAEQYYSLSCQYRNVGFVFILILS